MAADINRVTLVGRLTRDADLKYTTSGIAVCKFSIAVNRSKKTGDQWTDEVNFFDIVVWGKQGEAVNKYLVKGKLVGVDGELRQDRWQQDGQNRTKVEIVADSVQLLGGNPGSSSGGEGSSYNEGGFSGGGARKTNSFSGGNSGEDESPSGDDGFTDDIPF